MSPVITLQSKAPKATTESQGTIDFERPREGVVIYIRVVSDGPNIAAHYEGDLAVSGNVGGYEFQCVPVPEVYTQLELRFGQAIDEVLRKDDAPTVANDIAELRKVYSAYGRLLYGIASRTVCTDSSRLTSVMGFMANYLYTLLHISRQVLGDGSTPDGRSGPIVIVIDRYLAGLQKWDGAGINWGFEPNETISRVQRADLSRKAHNRGSNGRPAEDARLADLVGLLAGSGTSFRKGLPSAIHLPLADAFRGSVNSVSLVAASAAASWRSRVIAARDRYQDDDL